VIINVITMPSFYIAFMLIIYCIISSLEMIQSTGETYIGFMQILCHFTYGT
jgi:hypothetical protein